MYLIAYKPLYMYDTNFVTTENTDYIVKLSLKESHILKKTIFTCLNPPTLYTNYLKLKDRNQTEKQ